MYTIGRFAFIGKVSPRTLRLYDEKGLLKPAHVDGSSQYRYYIQKQVQELLFINKLKQYGFSLAEIKDIKERNEISYFREQLQLRLGRLEDELRNTELTKRLLTDEVARLGKQKNLFKENESYAMEIIKLPARLVVSCREIIKLEDIGKLIGKVYEDIYQHGLEVIDSHSAIYHDEEFNPLAADVEVYVPVAQGLETDEFSTRMIAEKTYARTTYTGAISCTGEGHAALLDWIEQNKYAVNGPPTEKYLTAKQFVFNPCNFQVEIYYPVMIL